MKQSVWCSMKHSFRGLKTVFTTERNFRIHTLVAILVIAAAFWRGLDEKRWVMLLMVITLVMSFEIFNSAIERLVDMLAPRTHGFAKEIKDLLAGMVMIVSIFAVVVGLLIFL